MSLGNNRNRLSLAVSWFGLVMLAVGLVFRWQAWGNFEGVTAFVLNFDIDFVQAFRYPLDTIDQIGAILMVLAPCLSVAGWIAWPRQDANLAKTRDADVAPRRKPTVPWTRKGSNVGKVGLILWAVPVLAGLPLLVLALLFAAGGAGA
jgi:hypothetical protein